MLLISDASTNQCHSSENDDVDDDGGGGGCDFDGGDDG